MTRTVEALLLDIRSAHNVGAMFRTADCAGIQRIHLSGYTPSPMDEFGRLRADIAKTALGAIETVSWDRLEDVVAQIATWKEGGMQVIALEQDAQSTDYRRVPLSERVVFIVGNEVEGIPRAVCDMADVVVSIPCRGEKESLNVASAFSVAAYAFTDEDHS